VEIDRVDPVMDDAVSVEPVSVEKFVFLVFSVDTLIVDPDSILTEKLEPVIVDAVSVEPVRVEKFALFVFSVDTLIVDAFKVDPDNVEMAIALVFKVDTLMVELKIWTLRFAKNDIASLLRIDKDGNDGTRGYEGIRSISYNVLYSNFH
jgi:hypothetical protein